METTVYQSNISIFHKSLDLLISSILTNNKPIQKIPFRKPRRSWEDNVRMDLKEIGIKTTNWVDADQDRGYWRTLVNASWTSGFHKP